MSGSRSNSRPTSPTTLDRTTLRRSTLPPTPPSARTPASPLPRRTRRSGRRSRSRASSTSSTGSRGGRGSRRRLPPTRLASLLPPTRTTSRLAGSYVCRWTGNLRGSLDLVLEASLTVLLMTSLLTASTELAQLPRLRRYGDLFGIPEKSGLSRSHHRRQVRP